MSKTLEEKTCIFQVLYPKPQGVKCYECQKYNEICPSYIPMVETNIERVERIRRQLDLKFI